MFRCTAACVLICGFLYAQDSKPAAPGAADRQGARAPAARQKPKPKQAAKRKAPARAHGAGHDDEAEVEWASFDMPGEGRKIVTHLGLMPDLSHDATHTLSTGAWPDLPPDARVLIPEGVTVEYDRVLEPRVKSLALKGTLKWSRTADTRLRVGTIQQFPGAVYDQGTPDDPVKGRCEIIFDDVIDTTTDPEQITVGHIAFGGVVHICGDFVGGANTTEMTEPAEAGASTIKVATTTGWKVGDELLLADSQKAVDGSKYSSQAERVHIAAIDGSTLTLAAPMKWLHDGDVDHLTRNIVYSSAPESARGHTLYMSDIQIQVCCARFNQMGRTTHDLLNDTIRGEQGEILQLGTNQRGRYPVHAHHPKRPFLYDRLVIDSSPKWGLSHHDSHGVVSHCVVIDASGAGIVGEDGVETGEHFGNSVTRTLTGGAGERDYKRYRKVDIRGKLVNDRGFSGAGYWYRGPLIACYDNKANGNFRTAFEWNFEAGGMPNVFTLGPIEGRDPALVGFPIDLEHTTPLRIENLKIRGMMAEGITIWGLGTGVMALVDRLDFENCGRWGIGVMLSHNRGGTILIRDSIFRALPEVEAGPVCGAEFGIHQMTFQRVTNIGFSRLVNEAREMPDVLVLE